MVSPTSKSAFTFMYDILYLKSFLVVPERIENYIEAHCRDVTNDMSEDDCCLNSMGLIVLFIPSHHALITYVIE